MSPPHAFGREHSKDKPSCSISVRTPIEASAIQRKKSNKNSGGKAYFDDGGSTSLRLRSAASIPRVVPSFFSALLRGLTTANM